MSAQLLCLVFSVKQEVRLTALEKGKGQTAEPVERGKGSKELVQE